MKVLSIGLGILSLTLLGSVWAGQKKMIPFQLQQEGPARKVPPDQFSRQVEDVIRQETNQVRKGKGRTSLKNNAVLTTVARGHSRDMMKRNYLSHFSPEGKTMVDRVTGKVKKLQTDLGENIHMISSGKGLYDPQAIVNLMMADWMRSKSHRDNLLSKKFTQIGVGCVSDGYKIYCTQLFSGPNL